MEYVVEVVPPQAGEPVFEIREPGYAEACARARRYRERGWDPGSGTPHQVVLARSCDCALHQGRRLQPGACAVQPLEGGDH